MKRFGIILYVNLHKKINGILVALIKLYYRVFYQNTYAIAFNQCNKYKTLINTIRINYSGKIAAKEIIELYQQLTDKFLWTVDYMYGAIDIHPDCILFLLKNSRDDCDGPATAFISLFSTESNKGVKIKKLVLYSRKYKITQLKFWKTLHIVIRITSVDTDVILSNGSVYLYNEYMQTIYPLSGEIQYTTKHF